MRQQQATNDVLFLGRACAVLASVLCVAPLPLLLFVALGGTQSGTTGQDAPTLRWLAMSWSTVGPYALWSLQLALLTLLLNIVLGLPAAFALARHRFWGRAFVRGLLAVPLTVPGIAIALALILAYPTWRGNGSLLLLGHVLYTLPFFVGIVEPTLGQAALEERERVAATLGANRVQRFLFVTLPGVRTALLAAAITTITLSLGEFNVTFFLFTPTAKTLPVDLFASYITGRLEVAAAATVWFLVLVIPAAVAIERWGGARIGQA